MQIDITSLNNLSIGSINIDKEVYIPEDLYKSTEILELKDLKFLGSLEKIEDELTLKGELTGIMVLEDSISLDKIDYTFKAEIDEEIEENLEKSLNTLDITEILWQNIVLEVPLRLTNVDNFDDYHGDGWKLISEDSIKNTNNPFSELEDMMGKE